MKPQEIETLSFRIIDSEAADAKQRFTEDQWTVVRRMIHTSADFEYLESVRFHAEAMDAGIDAIRRGTPIVTDTRMAATGIRKSDLERFGGAVTCYIDDMRVRRKTTVRCTPWAMPPRRCCGWWSLCGRESHARR